MRLREDFEPASGVKRRPVQHKTEGLGDLLVPYGTLALCSGAAARGRHADEPGIKPADLGPFLNDGYHNAA